jgi:hypothetical protein
MFEHDASIFQNFTANSANALYNIYVDGTANITSIVNSPAFTSKGNFYQVSDEAKASIPKIYDQNGNQIVADPDADRTYYGVEPWSGQVMQIHDNYQINY